MGTKLKTEFLVSDEIHLRTFRRSDVEAIYLAVLRNLDHLKPYMHWVTPDYSIESAREFIERCLDGSAGPERPHNLGIFRGERLIGVVGFVKFDWTAGKTEIGYWIDKAEEGKGIISGACGILLDHAFRELGLNRVEIRCAATNLRSAAIPERFGFKMEGILRQSEFRDGHLHDFKVYGLLAEEWDPTRLGR